MRQKSSNKGFSLVELIIVIAIMLVLVGILAPQFVKYVHRARIAADMASAKELAEAIQAMLADGGSVDEAEPAGGYSNIWTIKGTYVNAGSVFIPAGSPIHGLDGISVMPVSKIDKDYLWGVYYNNEGEVFVGLAEGPTEGKRYGLYPEYVEGLVWAVNNKEELLKGIYNCFN